jgi:hypothetical protein
MANQVVTLEAPKPQGVYLHSIAGVQGTVAPQTFITLFNPVGSGKNITLATAAISYSNTMPATDPAPLRGWRISAASGGTLIAAASIAKFNTLYPNSVAQVRIADPAVTLTQALFNSPAPIDNRSSSVHTVDVPAGAAFIMRPGEGIALRRETGVTSTFWNITLVWAEFI